MAPIRIAGFKGEVPALEARLLPESAAQVAANVRLDTGGIEARRVFTPIYTFGSAMQTIYRHNGAWMGWPGQVEPVPGPVAADRLYLTGQGQIPKVMISGTTYDLAVPAPVAAPALTLLGTLDTDDAEVIHYAYTFVTSFDEESAPSPLSGVLQWSEGLVVRVSGFSAPVAGRSINRVRLYRSQTGATGNTDLFFVDEFLVGTSTRDHDITLAPLQEQIPSGDYDLPPTGLRGLIALPNGMMAGFSGKEVFFCEPWIPHAWPRKYALAMDFNVVGLAAFGSTIAILTTGNPYIAQGTHPDSMAMEKVEANLPCLSRLGIVDLGYAAAYPSPEGLVIVSQSGTNVVTRGLFTREQWNAMNPATIVAAQFAGKYLFSYDDGTRRMAEIDISGGQAVGLIRHNGEVQAIVSDVTGSLHVLGLSGITVSRWENPAANRTTFIWRSRLYHGPVESSYAVIKVDGVQSGSIAIRVFADGVLLHTVTVMNRAKWLPARFATRWEIEVEGTASRITAISMGNSMDDLVAA